MNYYERHLGDYARDTAHLSLLEHGVYTLLLDRYYATEAPIPVDQAHRVARARSREEKAAVDSVLAEFFALDDGVYRNNRADEEIAKLQAWLESQRANGKKGGRPRKTPKQDNPPETQKEPMGFDRDNPNETQSKAHQTPDTSTTPERSSALIDPEARAPDHDTDAWTAFEEHHRQIGRWSSARSMLAKGQLRKLEARGVDTDAVLTWATVRGLSDLDDAARRMAADAAKETHDASRRRPGESLAAQSERINRELDERERATVTALPGTAARAG